MIPLVLVAAVADNGVIGDDDRLIWRLKTDMKRFRALTMGRPMIMGRKTFASIGKPLPGRATIVVTRDRSFAFEGVHVVHDIPAAVALGRALAEKAGCDTLPVVGGAEIYRQLLPEADALLLTLVHASPPGDAVFPSWPSEDFREIAREEHPAGPDDEHAFAFVDLERVRPDRYARAPLTKPARMTN
jgi:dihydrofolate reductase